MCVCVFYVCVHLEPHDAFAFEIVTGCAIKVAIAPAVGQTTRDARCAERQGIGRDGDLVAVGLDGGHFVARALGAERRCLCKIASRPVIMFEVAICTW